MFWEYVFKQNVFASRQRAVSSQQPPTDDLRRVDFVVENIDDNSNSTTLLIMEAKRANATLDQIDEVECQALYREVSYLGNSRRWYQNKAVGLWTKRRLRYTVLASRAP